MSYPRASTESVLREWRYGQATAERLCAAILSIEGFESVDPQCPLGGPDGLKDVLCEKNGHKWVAAAYFPTTEKSEGDAEDKFGHDLPGVATNKAAGIVFFTNQRLGPTMRTHLEDTARDRGALCIVYHLERIRAVLDAPRGYGARLQFLNLPMTHEEQFGFLGEWKDDVASTLRAQADALRELQSKVAKFGDVGQMLATLSSVVPQRGKVVAAPTMIVAPGQAPDLVFGFDAPASGAVTTNMLLMLHRAVSVDLTPVVSPGRFRTAQVWIGPPGARPDEAVFIAPPWDEVPGRVRNLLQAWALDYERLAVEQEGARIEAIASFHHALVSIHPFMDANGRVARLLLQQQAVDLLGYRDSIPLDEGAMYYEALRSADRGDRQPLIDLTRQAILA